MKIAFVSSEAVPYAKTGGLADVAGALPKYLEKLGCEVKLFIPKYFSIDEDKFGLHYNWDTGEIPIRVAGQARPVHIHQAMLPGSNVQVNFIDCTQYFFRSSIYTNDPDEGERFILLCKAAIESMQRMQWQPDIIHCNDWQSGLLPLFIKDNYTWDKLFDKTATLFTIHNIGYQGRFSKETLLHAEIKGSLFYPGGPIEHENSVSFMKAGIAYADIINTVSVTYAHEILTPEYGAGMENFLSFRQNDLYGILNGVDYSTWNPETDTHIPFNYSIDNIKGKEKNKKFLMEHLNLPYNPDVPLIGIVSRLVSQKGFDIFASAIADILQVNAQWIILGSGEEKYEQLFRNMASLFPEKFSCYIGFNNELSHLIEAGADMFLMPSHYEPCGLNQIYSLKYGTVPVVRKTGGLADTVIDWHELKYGFDKEIGTGFSFQHYSPHALAVTIARAVETFKFKDTWRTIQKNGMSKDYSWDNSAKKYVELYKKAIAKRK